MEKENPKAVWASGRWQLEQRDDLAEFSQSFQHTSVYKLLCPSSQFYGSNCWQFVDYEPTELQSSQLLWITMHALVRYI